MTFCYCSKNFVIRTAVYAGLHKDFNNTYRFYIEHTKDKIGVIT